MKNARITKLKVKKNHKSNKFYYGGANDTGSIYDNLNQNQSQNMQQQSAPADVNLSLNNTMKMGSAGSSFGPVGTAVGATAGLAMDVLNYNKNQQANKKLTDDIRSNNQKLVDTNNPYANQGYQDGGVTGDNQNDQQEENTSNIPTDQGLFFEGDVNDVPEIQQLKIGDYVTIHACIDRLEDGKFRLHLEDFEPMNETNQQETGENEEPQAEDNAEYVSGGFVHRYNKKGGWIQKATASIKRRGTKGVCTGSKFGGPTCRPGTRRYALAKTFKAMAKNRNNGGSIDNINKMADGGAVTGNPTNLSSDLKKKVLVASVINNQPTHFKEGGNVPDNLHGLFARCMKEANNDPVKAKELVKQYLKHK